jgi:hypothetical protein
MFVVFCLLFASDIVGMSSWSTEENEMHIPVRKYDARGIRMQARSRVPLFEVVVRFFRIPIAHDGNVNIANTANITFAVLD